LTFTGTSWFLPDAISSSIILFAIVAGTVTLVVVTVTVTVINPYAGN
jgi:hypothetical protein